jgi:hypothetical protein
MASGNPNGMAFVINFVKVTIDSEVVWIGRYREKLVTSHFSLSEYEAKINLS